MATFLPVAQQVAIEASDTLLSPGTALLPWAIGPLELVSPVCSDTPQLAADARFVIPLHEDRGGYFAAFAPWRGRFCLNATVPFHCYRLVHNIAGYWNTTDGDFWVLAVAGQVGWFGGTTRNWWHYGSGAVGSQRGSESVWSAETKTAHWRPRCGARVTQIQ